MITHARCETCSLGITPTCVRISEDFAGGGTLTALIGPIYVYDNRVTESQALGPRQCGHFYLVAARNVAPGEELTWHYGAGYDPRDYAVGEAVTVACRDRPSF